MKTWVHFVILFTTFVTGCFAVDSDAIDTPIPEVVSGSIQRLAEFPSQYVAARNVDIWLPEGFDAEDTEQRYQVLYMHDGQMLFDASKSWNGQEWAVDDTMSQMIEQQKIAPTIVVGVWNGGADRWSDYCPQKPFEQLPMSFVGEMMKEHSHLGGAFVNSDGYLKFLVAELKPYIDAHFPTKPEMESTFVAGSSMGGLISMYAICEYPSVFGAAACLSSHWPGANPVPNNPFPEMFVSYLKTHLPDSETHKIYFDHGTETLDQHYGKTQIRIDEVMQNAGWNSENWKTQVFEGTNHSEDAWKARLHIPVEFLMGR